MVPQDQSSGPECVCVCVTVWVLSPGRLIYKDAWNYEKDKVKMMKK